MRSWDSSVGIATDYGLDGRDSMPGSGKKFCLLHIFQNDTKAHPAFYPMRSWGSFIADHSPSSSAEVNFDGDIPPYLHTSSWRSA
jgi:hypothetical protein